MSQIIHRAGSLFDAPEPRILVHACNAQGVWGAGVAKQMKARYPKAYASYRYWCHSLRSDVTRGAACCAFDGATIILSLITSRYYGAFVDSPSQIVAATQAALESRTVQDLITSRGTPLHFHSPRINAGNFGVRWERTEAVIAEAIAPHPHITWTVWSPLE